MANYCWNWIHITGSEQNIKKIKKIIESNEDGFWAQNYSLLLEKPELKWEDTNNLSDVYDEWGSKWFTPYIHEYELEEGINDNTSYIVISGDSAWSPMIPLCKKLSEHYNAYITIEYEEPGCDFGGKSYFVKGNLIEKQEYTYLEWQYINNNFEGVLNHFEDSINEEDTFLSLYFEYESLFKRMTPEERKNIYEIYKEIKNETV